MPKNAQTTAQLHSSHNASKVMLKILQARLQQYVNREPPDVQAGFRKGRGTRDQIANIRWIMEKAREFHKNIFWVKVSCLLSISSLLNAQIRHITYYPLTLQHEPVYQINASPGM